MVNPVLFKGYDTGSFYDEMFSAPGIPRLNISSCSRSSLEWRRGNSKNAGSSLTFPS